MPATNFYAAIAHTLHTQPAQPLLLWPPAAPAAPEPTELAPPTAYSGAEIAAGVASIRRLLEDAGTRPGQRVLLLLPVSFTFIGAVLAA